MSELANVPMIVRAAQPGGFLRSNRAFTALVGISARELASRPFHEWIHSDDQQAVRAALSGATGCCRARHRTSDGGFVELELQVRDQGQGPVVLGRAVSEEAEAAADDHANADATVKGTLHKIASIVEEQNPDFRCSILLVAHGRFVAGAGPSLPEEYNNAIDGFAIGPTVGSCGTAIYWNVPVIVEDIQNDPLWVPFAALAEKAGVAACWSHPFVSKQGRVLGALALYSPEPRAPTAEQLQVLRAAAQMTGLAVERGRAEEELRAANEVKARFMANMSHEIRTPLNALIGLTDSLLENEGVANADDIRMLHESGEQLLGLFNGVLELTEVRDRKDRDKIVDLRALCRSIFEQVEQPAAERKLHFAWKLSERVPQWVRIDAWSLERALTLLLHNAVKFTDYGTVQVELDYELDKLQVRICDTGRGIELDRLEELREPFVQGDLSTTKQYSGFGLGLAVSDLCVHALGGKLEFRSNVPQGTTVGFQVPVASAEDPNRTTADVARPPSTTTSGRVLVVEDNPLNSKVAERILVHAGYECDFVVNGQEALAAIERSSYACVLMDCQMPVMDGYEATRRIREREASSGAHVPIIAVTANALAEDRDLCLQAGMDDYLSKPVRRRTLVETVAAHIGTPQLA